MSSCDVLVAGGGSAGVAAAIAAARTGARTILVERGGMLGGMGSAAFVHTVCGLYRLGEREAAYANRGFAPEFAGALLACGGARGPVRMGKVDVMLHDPIAFASVSDRLCASEHELSVWGHSEIIGASTEGGRVARVEIHCAGERRTIVPRVCVDATGDGALGRLAGGAWQQEPASRLQRPAYIAMIHGLPSSSLSDEGRIRAAHAIAEAAHRGDLPRAALGAAFRPGVREGCAFVTIDLEGEATDGTEWDPLSPVCRARAERDGREIALAILGHLARNAEGWGEAGIAAWPSRLGIRESARLAGVHELTAEEVLGGMQFGDGVVEVAWPIELRERATGARWRYADGLLPAQIPLRSLRHRELSDFWMAGRCLSASHEALASVRVMGTSLATGEMAGIAAALTADTGLSDMSWQDLAAHVTGVRDRLRRT